MKLLKCKICGRIPCSFEVQLSQKGCDILVWCVECSNDESGGPFPYVDHRVSIYGKTETCAIERWNKVMTLSEVSE